MYKEKITELISLNDIDDNEFHEKLFRTLLLGVFETICKEMKKQNKKQEEKEKFRNHKDKIVACKMIVRKYAGCQLNEEGYAFLANLLIAHFRTGDPRKKHDDKFRAKLTNQQHGLCAICKKQITTQQAHLDHIIPWDYVGDELNENYQMLCETCNERKGTATYFEFSRLLLNRKECRSKAEIK